ncbi:hypothetical protein BC833DRAFT_639508 [Globomyces pollinis-pini]|nr:hypothetical protein BC833DRAFT_639508 [Globomyces pollinis-pini]
MTCQRVKIVRGLQALVTLIQQPISSLCPQVIGLLQLFLQNDELWDAALEAWGGFTRVIDEQALNQQFIQVAVTLLEIEPKCNDIQRTTMIGIFEYLVFEHIDHIDSIYLKLIQVPDTAEWNHLRMALQSKVEGISPLDQLKHLVDQLRHENASVILYSLKKIDRILLNNELAFQMNLLDDTSDPIFKHLIQNLFTICTKYHHLNNEITSICCKCIGTLGAPDPSRVNVQFHSNETYGADLDLSTFGGILRFACLMIQNHFVPIFQATQDSNTQNVLAYSIQEVLGCVGFTSNIVENAQSLQNSKPKDKSDNSALLARYWLQLSKLTTNVIQPLVGAKYQVSAIENKPLNYPIYPKSKGFRVWLQSFVLDLIPKIGNPNVRNIFTACKHIISYGDMNLTQIYLPHIFVNVIISDNSIHYDDILKEFIAILSDSNAEEQHQLCLQTIFNLVDHLYQFIRHYRVKISKIKIRNTASSGQSLLTQFQFELGRVERLVNDIPQSLMAEASIRCQAYARALLHFEQHIRSEMRYKSNEEMQLMYGQLQKIYAHLEDSDAIEGLIIKLNNPTLEQQIIQHEVGGRWTAAQSCYEVLLQQSPEETAYQFGMLNCLQNMGHYGIKELLNVLESLITYASGIMERHPSKIADTIPFTIAASWRLGEWKQLKEYLGRDSKYSFESALGKLLLSIYEKNDLQFDQILLETREKLNSSIAAASMESYKRSYDTVLQLSMLSEIEQFYSKIVKKPMCSKADISKVMELWQARLNSTVSSFKVREPILNLRRILLSIKTEFTTEVEGELIHSLTEQKGKLWIQSAKESRKSEYFQTSFSSILQALEMSKNLAKVEHAKYLWARNEHYQAMLELKALLKCDFRNIKTIASTSSDIHLVELNELQISKAKLKLAAWLESTNGLHSSNIIAAYIQINRETPNWEKGNFYLGRFYNRFYEKEKQPSTDSSSNQVSSYNIPNLSYLIVKQYGKSLLYGTKYLYQSLPRMLTVWLDLGMVEEEKTVEKLTQTNAVMRKFVSRLPAYQFLTAMPQLISRICHPNPEVQEILESIIVSVLCVYPQQTLWHLMAVAKSTVKSRVRRIASIFSKVKSDPTFRQLDPQLVSKIQYAEAFVDQLLNLCNFPSGKDVSMLSMSRDFRKLQKMAALGNGMIVPLQSSLTVTLPTGSYSASSHKPFANDLPRIIGFKDEIEIVTSLQRPKKITMIGSNGHNYIFLCKPEDDLRKDSRLMEFNSIVNRLLKKDSEGRKRKLHIRTYAVVPLNEKCGLIQWVLGTSGFRNILIKYYKSRGIYTSHQVIKEALAKTSPSKVEIFTNVILPKYKFFILNETRHPPIFQNWFLESFPEPTKWLASRSAYTSTTATMSMVGYVVGLGDRHGENILFDELTGECLHVDLNCLFEKGLEFEIPERVPFRLTHNMVDAFGISGIEGSFRKSCEVSLRVLRANRELLMSVLETFLHDPLCEWSKSKNHKNEETEVQNPKAIKSLAVIDRKLQGCIVTARLPLSVEGQVDELICQATNPENLCQMYIGWAPYL